MTNPTTHDALAPEDALGRRGSNGHTTVRVSQPGRAVCAEIPKERISDVLPDPHTMVWVNIPDPTPEDIEMLREEFGFHELALEDAAKQRQRPKVDEYPGYYFVVLYAPVPGTEAKELEVVEVDLFVGRNYVVCLHSGRVPAIADAMHRWERTEAELRGKVGFLLHTVMDAIIDSYFPVVDDLEDRLDEMELAMFAGERGAEPADLLRVKRMLFTLRRAIYPMREVFNSFLRRDHHLFAPETYPYFQDVYDHVLRLLDVIDIQRDLVTGVMDAHLAVVSNRLNATMKSLTVVAVVVAIMGAVFGAWGMNFERIPLSTHPDGFWIVFGGMLTVISLIIVAAKLRRWW